MLNKYSTIFWDFDGVIINSDEVRTEGFKYIFDSYSKEYIDKLEDKMKLIDLCLTMAFDGKVNYGDVLGTTKDWDVLI